MADLPVEAVGGGDRDQWNQRLLEVRSTPDVLEQLWRHRRVAHRIGDRGVPESDGDGPDAQPAKAPKQEQG